MGVGAGLYMCDVVKSSRSLSHLLMSSCQYYAKALARKNVSEMTYFCLEWDVKP